MTIVVAAIGAFLSTRLVAGSVQERINSQLLATSSVVADELSALEDTQLADLRTITFTDGFEDAVVERDKERIQMLLFPLVVSKDIDRVDILNHDGNYLFGIQRPAGSDSVEDYMVVDDLNGIEWTRWPIVQSVLSGVVDDLGDKFVTIETIDNDLMFFTAGPLKQENQIIGTVLVSTHIPDLLGSLKQATLLDVSLYDLDGDLIDTTFLNREKTAQVLSLDRQAQIELIEDGKEGLARSVSLGDVLDDYEVLYNVFRARGEPLGFYSVALYTDYINSSNTNARNQMVLIFAITLLLVFFIGYVTANAITRPVQHLMENAMAVASGDLTRRTKINSNDEIGSLARSLDHMTESLANYTHKLQNRIAELVLLYENSTAVTVKSGLNLDHITKAIVDSIKGVIKGTDQVVVYLLDANKQYLVPRASTSAPFDSFNKLPFFENGPYWNILSETKTQIVDLDQIKPNTTNGFYTNDAKPHALVVPLIASKEVIGMLALLPRPDQSGIGQLDEDNERLLIILANQFAITIKNAQLFDATQKAYEELRHLDDLKTEFINIAAHELRTPLGAMIGYASFLEKRVQPKLHKSVRFLIASSLRMRTMVDAMLAIQRLDAGTAFLRITEIHVSDIIEKTANDFRPMAELEGHTIEVDVPDDLPTVPADAEKIGLILSNLISNAIKFTPEGGKIEIIAQDYLKGILIKVKDNGVGISEEDQAQIFERFYQVRPDHLAGHGGMGIGLTIVKHLIELHNGQVWVESEENKGTTFFFTIPNEVSDEDADEEKQETDEHNPSGSLVVDGRPLEIAKS
ncbi:MAG: HAMP domain-containing protein [Anaerolineae bacterium]|nr:HAMP domain-containing protein [Anaerolineae bacterium]